MGKIIRESWDTKRSTEMMLAVPKLLPHFKT